jgi:TolB protein
MRLSRVSFIGVFFIAVAVPGFAGSTGDWEQYTDKQLHVTFRHPKEWKTSPLYYDWTYFGGPDGALQLSAAGDDTPQQGCQSAATHHLQPFGSHPRIRSLKVQGQKACLVWPSEEQGANADAELFVEFPQSIEVGGDRYNLFTLYADKNHILEIMKTLRFISRTSH